MWHMIRHMWKANVTTVKGTVVATAALKATRLHRWGAAPSGQGAHRTQRTHRNCFQTSPWWNSPRHFTSRQVQTSVEKCWAWNSRYFEMFRDIQSRLIDSLQVENQQYKCTSCSKLQQVAFYLRQVRFTKVKHAPRLQSCGFCNIGTSPMQL